MIDAAYRGRWDGTKQNKKREQRAAGLKILTPKKMF